MEGNLCMICARPLRTGIDYEVCQGCNEHFGEEAEDWECMED